MMTDTVESALIRAEHERGQQLVQALTRNLAHKVLSFIDRHGEPDDALRQRLWANHFGSHTAEDLRTWVQSPGCRLVELVRLAGIIGMEVNDLTPQPVFHAA